MTEQVDISQSLPAVNQLFADLLIDLLSADVVKDVIISSKSWKIS